MNVIKDVLDRVTLLSIIMISLLISLLSLSIPIAAQTLINLIAFGKLLQPVITLSIIVLILMLALGALNIWQTIIVEVIQQKLVVKISFNLTKQFTHLSLDNFSVHHGPELVNRFFEVVTINKALASLLLYGINLSLQLFFGLLLLVVYHPIFLFFDGFIIFSILLIIFIPYQKGLESAQNECTQKNQIGAWLEELLTNRFLFRFNNYHRYATYQADKRLVFFLKARNIHFKQLIKHQIGFYILSALASSLLLSLGGYLVINDQLSLGQLVASEIVLSGLIYSFKRFGVLLENYYDLMASENKIDAVLNLPTENIKTEVSELIIPIKTIKIRTKEGKDAFAYRGKPLLIKATESQQSQLFTEFILGFRKGLELEVFINDMLCMDEHRKSLRQYTLFIKHGTWFVGSIYDNLLLNQPSISTYKLKELLNSFGLIDKVMRQPNGLRSIIYEWESTFNELELIQLMVIRAILAEPELVIIDCAFDGLKKENIDSLMLHLLRLKNTIVLIVTQQFELINLSNCLVLS